MVILLVGTSAATEARLELVTRRKTSSSPPVLFALFRVPLRLRKPNASTPLKTKLALPSHRLSKLNTALIIVGAFLGSVRRTTPLRFGRPGVAVLATSHKGVPLSTALPGLTPVNCVSLIPWEVTES